MPAEAKREDNTGGEGGVRIGGHEAHCRFPPRRHHEQENRGCHQHGAGQQPLRERLRVQRLRL
jgi:hypothetical protein